MSAESSNSQSLHTTCCIVGGGPAGMVLGFLLARAGVDVQVLEKHADFFRDFRGDTIHPSTMQIMHELGLLEEFLKLPHNEFQHLSIIYNGVEVTIVDFTHLKTARAALGIMPQWDFLNFILKQAEKYKNFQILLQTEVKDIIKENGKITGVIAESPAGQIEIRAALVIGTDGRHSIVREKAGFRVLSTGAPIDVLWFRLPKEPGDPEQTLGRFDYGRIMIMVGRGDYWQCGYIIEKNGYEKLKSAGLQQLKKELLIVSPFLSNRMDLIKDWEDIKLLSVVIDHLEKWYCDGLLCIGDAAHAMSPVGGVGINLAIQDAVAAAELDYISSVFAHNVAKLSLARALGGAADKVELFLKLK